MNLWKTPGLYFIPRGHYYYGFKGSCLERNISCEKIEFINQNGGKLVEKWHDFSPHSNPRFEHQK